MAWQAKFDEVIGPQSLIPQLRSSGLDHRDALFACSMLLLALMLDGWKPAFSFVLIA